MTLEDRFRCAAVDLVCLSQNVDQLNRQVTALQGKLDEGRAVVMAILALLDPFDGDGPSKEEKRAREWLKALEET